MDIRDAIMNLFGEEYDEDAIPESFIINGDTYRLIFSEKVQQDIKDGKILLSEIECSLLGISSDVFIELIHNEELLYICEATNVHMVLTVNNNELQVNIASRSEDLKVY